jgi:hypothetical protein
MTPKARSREANGKVLPASHFWGHPVFDLPKANKNDEKLETNMP